MRSTLKLQQISMCLVYVPLQPLLVPRKPSDPGSKRRVNALSLCSDEGRSSLDIRLCSCPILSYYRHRPNSHLVDPQVARTEVGEVNTQPCGVLAAVRGKIQIEEVVHSPVVVGMKAKQGFIIFDSFGRILLNHFVITSENEEPFSVACSIGQFKRPLKFGSCLLRLSTVLIGVRQQQTCRSESLVLGYGLLKQLRRCPLIVVGAHQLVRLRVQL